GRVLGCAGVSSAVRALGHAGTLCPGRGSGHLVVACRALCVHDTMMDIMAEPLPLVFDAPRRGLPPRHFADLNADQRPTAMSELAVPACRGKQRANQHFGRLEGDPDARTDIPAGLRGAVHEELFPELASTMRHIECDDGTTRTTLWKLHDGSLVESVLMRYPDTATVCNSSQAGCRMAWPVCAAGQGGQGR